MDMITKAQLSNRRLTQQEAFEFFDSLEPVLTHEMTGLWKGEDLRTGHPLEGLLEAAHWYGKAFISSEEVHPLLFQPPDQERYAGNPALVPVNKMIAYVPKFLVSIGIRLIHPLFKTHKSKARLRMIEYRGQVTAAMIYDQKAIIDIFRKIDADTLLGVMDVKNFKSEKSYFFLLRKVREK
ncbi:DUF4334 domain-containing protein [Macrococcus carouselicus]|uniref:DUF4334 domain-containing protein n=1 Tax=Macrococcus carouselicus TaxID=69969 RepID=A0A9Q8FPV5_9STAP|nr:DUF4334 domain-containing protein [Macrococcus carouselicus]TDM02403.1 DUF4334 domain-containing protein [Macrococcus carouselicus]